MAACIGEERTGVETTGDNNSRIVSLDKSSASRKKPTSFRSASPSKEPPTGSSTKSDSGSRPHPKLSRILKRKPRYRDFTDDDIKYLWVVYKKANGDLSASEYRERILASLPTTYHYAWIMETDKPIGVAFGVNAGPMVLFGDVQWFPWATPRNKLESLTNLLHRLRKQHKVILYCNKAHNKFFVYLSRAGILRRVGHLHAIYEGEPAILFETK